MAQDGFEQPARDMTCREVAEWTSAYLDEHVDDTTKIPMAMHLATCAGCEAYVKQIALIRETLAGLPKIYPTSIDRLRLRRHFAAQHSR